MPYLRAEALQLYQQAKDILDTAGVDGLTEGMFDKANRLLDELDLKIAEYKGMESAPVFGVGGRVRVNGTPHMEGQDEGEVREAVLTWVYGIAFDNMPGMVHHWYVESELMPVDDMNKAAAEPQKRHSALLVRRLRAAELALAFR